MEVYDIIAFMTKRKRGMNVFTEMERVLSFYFSRTGGETARDSRKEKYLKNERAHNIFSSYSFLNFFDARLLDLSKGGFCCFCLIFSYIFFFR